MLEKLTKCAACRGRGYTLCDCWPGDCICGFGDLNCEECGGEGIIDPSYDDDDWGGQEPQATPTPAARSDGSPLLVRLDGLIDKNIEADIASMSPEIRQRYKEAFAASPSSSSGGSLGITKEWFERRAKAEGDLEIGAGFSIVNPTDADLAQMEVLMERALPQWAQDELSRLRLDVARLKSERLYIVGCNEGFEAAIELAGNLVTEFVVRDTNAGKDLMNRQDGNQDGLHYAKAIRALSATAKEGE